MSKKPINQSQRAAIAWDILTQVAKDNGKIRYGKLADKIGIHHRPIRFVLELIQKYCLQNHLPPLTSIVVGSNDLPGTGFIAWDIDNIDEGFQKVYGENWDNLANPWNYTKDGLTETEIINQLLDNPGNSQDIYAKVKVRGTAQPLFRQALLQAYNHRCVFCGLSIEIVLQGAHIISWSEAQRDQRLDVRNGLLLCATHHKLFDDGWLIINDDYTIGYNPLRAKKGKGSEYDKILTTALYGKKILLPANNIHWPNVEYLKQHRQKLKKQAI